MDELEFHRILTLFPVVRSRDYHAESESSRQSTSQTKQNVEVKELQDAWIAGDTKGIDIQDAFWEKLKLAAKKKVGATEAESFVKAFQLVYKKLVYEELSLGAAKSFINLS